MDSSDVPDNHMAKPDTLPLRCLYFVIYYLSL